MSKGIIVTGVACLLLAGCSEVQAQYKGYEDQAVKAAQNTNDDALDLWKKTSCALTYGAVMRDAQARAILPTLCDPKMQPTIPTPTLAP